MKVVSALLIAACFGFYLGLTGCEKDGDQAEAACAAATIGRLGLIGEEPDGPCPLQVGLFLVGDEFRYSISTSLCFVEDRWYTCEGSRIEPDTSGGLALQENTEFVRTLGFVPADRYCVESVVSRLGLLAEDPGTNCSVSVNLLLKDEQYFFEFTSPVCRLTTPPVDCDGEPVCDTGDGDCLADFYRHTERLYNIGYLPE